MDERTKLLEKVDYYTTHLINKGFRVDDYNEWVNDIGFPLAELGEDGREFFHRISSTSDKYKYSEEDKKFTGLIHDHNGRKKIGSFFYLCTDVHQIPKFRKSTSTHHSGFSKAKSSEGEPLNTSLLDVRTANVFMEQAKHRPIPKMLFRELFHENELCILFADTNTGKSILAVQISDEISKSQPVMYCDFELSDKQFQIRYTDEAGTVYQFNDNFFRAEINPDVDVPEGASFEELLNASLEAEIRKSNIKVIVIDNITYLRSQTEKSHEALPLMKSLKRLKQKYNLSILCLAHTPKRDMTKPITRNDLQGSKMLINFCDSAFAIGESQQDKNIRYLKQIKSRNTEIIYDKDNVITCEVKKEGSFLKFQVMGFSMETDHLMQPSEKQKEERFQEVIELKKQGISNVEIAKRFGVTETAVRKWLKKAEDKPSPSNPSNFSNPSNYGSNGSNGSNDQDDECPF
jgi:hypothetical protein